MKTCPVCGNEYPDYDECWYCRGKADLNDGRPTKKADAIKKYKSRLKTRVVTCFALALIPLIAFYQLSMPPTYFSDEDREKYNLKGVLVLTPYLTANAYKPDGFYSYYNGSCNTACLTVPLDDVEYGYDSSKNMINIMHELKADVIPDLLVENDPERVLAYKTLILLHNEYVTQKMFDIISKHPNVIYLYPNSLYGKVDVDRYQMTLVRGHNYPEHAIKNGFDWQYDNTEYEYDNKCETPQWQRVPNGWQLDCYPEKTILAHKEILGFIKEKTQ